MRRISALVPLLALAGCTAAPPIGALVPPAAQPAVAQSAAAVEQKFAALCVGSGLFVLVNGWATSSVPVPGLALAGQLVDAGVDKVCADPARFAADASTIEWLVKNGLHPGAAGI